MDNQELNFIELNQSKVTDEVIQQFDCGNEDMTEYLHKYAKNDSIEGKGVTYVLVAEDRKRIYAYATIKAYSLYYYDDAEKYHTKEMNDEGKLLLAIPAVEIKMFAISRKLKGQVAYLLDPVKQQHYSSIFFKWFLEHLYYMSMNTIGFQMVFLRANDEARLGFQCAAAFFAFDDAELADGPDEGLMVAPDQKLPGKQEDINEGINNRSFFRNGKRYGKNIKPKGI